MPPQCRIDRVAMRSGKVGIAYSHDLVALPDAAMGYLQQWESAQDVRDDLQRLREYLREPERLVLLALLGPLTADPTLSAPTRTALAGRILTFDDASLTSPFGGR